VFGLLAWSILGGTVVASNDALQTAKSEYRIEQSARVVRVSRGKTTELHCLVGRETGRIAALVRHPTGTTFVAAQNGLFLASDDYDVLDRIDFNAGPPPGTPLGIANADDQRLFLLTSEALCAVEVRQFLWSALAQDSGLPPAPYSRLVVLNDGSFDIHHAAGVHRFVPDEAPVAMPAGVLVGGRELQSDQSYRGAPGAQLRAGRIRASGAQIAGDAGFERFRRSVKLQMLHLNVAQRAQRNVPRATVAAIL
jgi:hypothetical protein